MQPHNMTDQELIKEALIHGKTDMEKELAKRLERSRDYLGQVLDVVVDLDDAKACLNRVIDSVDELYREV